MEEEEADIAVTSKVVVTKEVYIWDIGKKDVAQKWPPLRVSCEREPNLVRNTCSPTQGNWNEHTFGHTGREKRKTSTEKQL